MNIAPDGTIYEILEDGTIKRIGKVSPNGEFEPFGGPKDGVRVRDGFIYRVINGKEQKIGQILPNGDIESINQRIKSEAEISRSKVKIVAILSVLIAFLAALGAGIYIFEEVQAAGRKPIAEVKPAFGEQDKVAIERMIAVKDLKNADKALLIANEETSGNNPYKQWLNEQLVLVSKEKTNQITFENGKTKLAQNNPEGAELLKSIPETSIFYKDAQNLLLAIPTKSAPKKEIPKAEPRKEEPNKAEPKKEEPWKAEPNPSKKQATMSEGEAKTLYMEANAMKDENPEKAKRLLRKIINSVDPESKRYRKAKELLEKL